MKKFGFGKKTEGDNDDHSRSGLFGRKKPAPQDDNPYAQQPAEDPYARMTPYQQAKANLAAGPQSPRPGAVGLPSGPGAGRPSGPAPHNGYGTPPPSYHGSPQVGGGYTSDKFGAVGGYGNNRYDSVTTAYGDSRSSSVLPSQRFPSRGPGGYGGLGSDGDDRNREDLLAGARIRPLNPPSYPGTDKTASGVPDANDSSYGGGYGEQRELTEEEQEKQEYHDIKNQIEDTLVKSDNAMDNALALLDRSMETGTGTLVRLAGQREMLSNTQRNIDLASNQHKEAVDKTKQLEILNRSMFIPTFGNPMTSKKRLAERERQIVERHELERENREAIRRNQYEANQKMEATFRNLAKPSAGTQLVGAKASSARSKYDFDEDDEDDGWAERQNQREEAINQKLDMALVGVKKLNLVARSLGAEVDGQNGMIGKLAEDSDVLDSDVTLARTRLARIR